ncbi:hypothetical protein JHK82_031594 [Glycine max]|nr:hypothetical protein JHK86_031679 [Glycine max]KAG5124857.1 hypothetical protein JHK82_031594 [Glycine max]KAG5146276.1 hypothetical protein JHK84_031819 [Glycine max]
MRMEKNEVCSKVATLKMGTKIEQRFFFLFGFFWGEFEGERWGFWRKKELEVGVVGFCFVSLG